MPNQPSSELIPDFIDAQLPSGTRLRFCFDEPLMSSDPGLLLLARHAAQSGDIERIATALAPKLKASAPGERKPRAPEHGTGELITQPKLARATFGEVRIKLFKLAARVRVMKTRVEVHLASKHPGSSLVAQIIGQALQVLVPKSACNAASSG
jgi:hypothetical protein